MPSTVKVRLSKDAPAQKHIPGVVLAEDKDGRPIPIEPNDVIEVDAELGKGLLEQSDKWEPGPKTVAPVNEKEA